jgi:uncharacterized protein (DUF58 family)
MLTSRGWWLFIATLFLLVVSVALGIGTLTLALLALLAWFLGAWLLFHVRLRWTAKALYVQRSLLRQGMPVEVLWAKSSATMVVRLCSDSRLALAYVLAADRVPALARREGGEPWNEGELHKDAPIAISYQIICPVAGRLRCDGLKVQIADLHGFFSSATFIRDVRSYRVLPPVTDEPGRLPTIKRHNLLPLLGTHRHLRPGSGSELLDLRDYLPGDPPKMIAWKASARRDRLMTKEFESEVPVRCTLFVDVSSSVRVGPPGANALTRVLAIASAVVHANAEQRDLTGLCLVDEHAVRASIRPERGRRHVFRLIQELADVADLAPVTEYAPLDRLVPLAYGVAQDIYPELLAADVNAFPWWLPFWSPQPIYSVPTGTQLPRSWPARWWFYLRRWLRESPIGVHRGRFFRFVPGRHRMYRLRKKVAAILAVRYRLGPAGLAWLLEDDVACSQYVQAFLAEHQVAAPLTLFDERGRYRFASPAKIERLGKALLGAVLRGKENELFVLLVDLLEAGPDLEPLLRGVRVALARHHQVQVICPWPPGVPLPGKAQAPPPAPVHLQQFLALAGAQRLQQAYLRLQNAFAQLGVSVIAAPEDHAVSLILSRLHKLRGWQRSVR